MIKKDGYGEYTWDDGKIYKGHWKKGKQHGEGEIYSPQDQVWKKGIWENGKRVRWIDSGL